MKLYVCDRCGQKITQKNRTVLILSTQDSDTYMDLCPDCFDSIQKFLYAYQINRELKDEE